MINITFALVLIGVKLAPPFLTLTCFFHLFFPPIKVKAARFEVLGLHFMMDLQVLVKQLLLSYKGIVLFCLLQSGLSC